MTAHGTKMIVKAFSVCFIERIEQKNYNKCALRKHCVPVTRIEIDCNSSIESFSYIASLNHPHSQPQIVFTVGTGLPKNWLNAKQLTPAMDTTTNVGEVAHNTAGRLL